MGRPGYPPEFRRKVLESARGGSERHAGRARLDISEQSICTWRPQDRNDRGLVPGLASKEKSELTAAHKRIAELEIVLKAARRAVELLREEAGAATSSC